MRIVAAPLAAALLAAACAGCHKPAANSLLARVGFSADSRGPDVGLAMLAGVDNARQALATHDRLAAFNDVDHALASARQLAGQSSALFPDEVPSAGNRRAGAARAGGPAPGLARFAAQVRLESADAALQAGDLARADADLAAIQSGVAHSAAPTLPLVRAEQSLELIRTAPPGEAQATLRTQLRTAEDALSDYQAPAHRGEAERLAAEIGRALTEEPDPSKIPPAQLSLWADKLATWSASA